MDDVKLPTVYLAVLATGKLDWFADEFIDEVRGVGPSGQARVAYEPAVGRCETCIRGEKERDINDDPKCHCSWWHAFVPLDGYCHQHEPKTDATEAP
jgi:hypothetical protein